MASYLYVWRMKTWWVSQVSRRGQVCVCVGGGGWRGEMGFSKWRLKYMRTMQTPYNSSIDMA